MPRYIPPLPAGPPLSVASHQVQRESTWPRLSPSSHRWDVLGFRVNVPLDLRGRLDFHVMISNDLRSVYDSRFKLVISIATKDRLQAGLLAAKRRAAKQTQPRLSSPMRMMENRSDYCTFVGVCTLTRMSEPSSKLGEEPVRGLDGDELEFIKAVAYPRLDLVQSDDTLKHFADVWWNLCQWEKQRADILDGKAQSLIGLASVASAVVSAAGLAVPSSGSCALFLRIGAVVAFLTTAALAIWAVRITEYGGFFDSDVFAALTISTEPAAAVPAYTDTNPFRSYLRETAIQRWLVYRTPESVTNHPFAGFSVAV